MRIVSYDIDKYGRTVGVIFIDGVNVNQSLIQDGLAWQYRKYCKASFCKGWLQLEKQARSSKAGLWSDTDPVPPWEWRKGVRNNSNIKSNYFHSSSCRHYNFENCVETFETRDPTLSSGYRPCGECMQTLERMTINVQRPSYCSFTIL